MDVGRNEHRDCSGIVGERIAGTRTTRSGLRLCLGTQFPDASAALAFPQ